MKDLTRKELEDGKEQIIGNYLVELEGSNETAVNLILEEISGNADNFYKYAREVNKISLEDIKKLAEKTDYASFVLSP